MKEFDTDHAIERYQAGESLYQLARSLGVSRDFIGSRFKERNVELRGMSDAAKIRFDRDPSHIRDCSAAGGRARAGGHYSEAALHQYARGRSKSTKLRGPFEDEIAVELLKRGAYATPQFALGRYNLDLAVESLGIAVEVSNGSWGPDKRPRLTERAKYILDSGWFLAYVIRPRHKTFNVVAVCDQLIALANIASRDEASRRQYGVIHCDGTTPARSGYQLGDLPRVPGF